MVKKIFIWLTGDFWSSLKTNYDDFLSGITVDLVLPALPLVLEFIGNKEEINEKTLSIFISTYVIVIGIQSRVKFVLLLAVSLCLIYTFIHGLAFTKAAPKGTYNDMGKLMTSHFGLVFIIYFGIGFCEKFYRILIKKENSHVRR